MKENYDIFATFITENVNNMIENSVFPVSLKQADIKPIYKKIPGMIRKTTGLYESYITCFKFMSVACIHRLTSTLTLLFLNISLDLEKDIMHSNVYLLCLKNGSFCRSE